jgi:hypothetical protein
MEAEIFSLLFPFFLINMRKFRFLLIHLLYIHELTCVRTLVGGGEVRERARLYAGRGRELQSPHANIRVCVFVCVCTCVRITSPLKHIKAQTKLIHAHTQVDDGLEVMADLQRPLLYRYPATTETHDQWGGLHGLERLRLPPKPECSKVVCVCVCARARVCG